MTSYVALLRAVNVGGSNPVAMADLRALASSLGLTAPRSLLQSGNLVFGSTGRSCAELEELLQEEMAATLGLRTEFFVRSAAEWRAIVAGNPFPAEAARDPGRLLAVVLKAAPAADAEAALRAAITGPEVVAVADRVAYIVYPAGVGRSRLTGAVIERKLGTRATGRNWNTVTKLAALVGA